MGSAAHGDVLEPEPVLFTEKQYRQSTARCPAIGAAFALQRGLGERLRNWKADRIAKAIAEESPIPLSGSKLLLHFIPAAVLTADEPSYPRTFEPQTWGQGANLFSYGAGLQRYNADGLLLASEAFQDNRRSYLQVFREGALEYGDSYVLDGRGSTSIASQMLEEKLVHTFAAAMILLGHLQIPEPIFVSLTLIGVKSRTVALPQHAAHFSHQSDPFDRDLILCPDVMLERSATNTPSTSLLLPLVNSLWQAAGRERTPYLDKEGAWLFAKA